jgi:hypothetical protein
MQELGNKLVGAWARSRCRDGYFAVNQFKEEANTVLFALCAYMCMEKTANVFVLLHEESDGLFLT